MGPILRLRLECFRDGHKPWVLPAEMAIGIHGVEGIGVTDVPSALT